MLAAQVTQVRVKFLDDQDRLIMRNVKGPVREGEELLAGDKASRLGASDSCACMWQVTFSHSWSQREKPGDCDSPMWQWSVMAAWSFSTIPGAAQWQHTAGDKQGMQHICRNVFWPQADSCGRLS